MSNYIIAFLILLGGLVIAIVFTMLMTYLGTVLGIKAVETYEGRKKKK